MDLLAGINGKVTENTCRILEHIFFFQITISILRNSFCLYTKLRREIESLTMGRQVTMCSQLSIMNWVFPTHLAIRLTGQEAIYNQVEIKYKRPGLGRANK